MKRMRWRARFSPMGTRWLILSGILIGGAGCATTVPPERLSATAAAIRSAEEMGAAQNPQAAMHLQLAEEKAERAKQIIKDGGSSQEATSLLRRSEADAELAEALARAETLGSEAKSAAERVKSLQKSYP